ncbi:hypothetical protein J3R30DRAFT_709757 [Lentinula aciculospora]|uniref:Uncharacterized protein n=1 Tax=Lentinula aciculospora TaxID=153920 RepID=A0A9W9A645_9AGAR|nr:hypothetical protein J3R30DRAFT_709757 [Lentinula aciculospora]
MHQHSYWQNQAHPNARYPPNHYPNHYPPQNAPKPSPSFRSQAELGFELPPVRPAQGRQVPAQPQQRPSPRGAPPLPSLMQGRPRPQSMGYPQTNNGYAPPMPANPGAVGIPPQLARSSSSSPTRKPLPAPAPAGGHRPLTVTQSSGFAPLPPNRPQSMDLSAFSRFNQERMASGAISAGTVMNAGLVKAFPNAYPTQRSQYQHQNLATTIPSAPPTQHTHPLQTSNSESTATPTRRRESPPKFLGNSGAYSSRNNSPEKGNFLPRNQILLFRRPPVQLYASGTLYLTINSLLLVLALIRYQLQRLNSCRCGREAL